MDSARADLEDPWFLAEDAEPAALADTDEPPLAPRSRLPLLVLALSCLTLIAHVAI